MIEKLDCSSNLLRPPSRIILIDDNCEYFRPCSGMIPLYLYCITICIVLESVSVLESSEAMGV